MSSDDQQSSDPPAVTAAPAEGVVTPVPAIDVLALADTTPRLVEPEMLVQGLRLLQERIPEFTQLSVKEKRSRALCRESRSGVHRERPPRGGHVALDEAFREAER